MTPEKKKLAKVEKKKPAKAVKPKAVAKPVKKVEKKPESGCLDRNCPVHGNNKTRGRLFEGIVIKAKMPKTVIVEWPRRHYLSKYERFEKRRSKVKAHNPTCIAAKAGDRVRIAECRPLSKTKNFVVVEVIK